MAHGGLGDIGHVIVQPFGMPCDSGCRGCAEATISAPGIEARAGGGVTVRELIARAHSGNAEAAAVFAETGRLLAVAIASQAVILFPDVVAIAGGVAEAGEWILAPARDAFGELTGPFYREGVTIAKAELGWQASLVGAALPLFG
jgi:glucokinase